MLPIESYIAVRATSDLAQSALPQAPVRAADLASQREPRRRRARTARLLRRVADRLEPPPSGPGDRFRAARA